MTGFELKSFEFRREREASWRELETLIELARTDGLRSFRPQELHRLPVLYRGVLSSLSVARAISLDRNLISYLEALAARSYLLVYGSKRNYASAVAEFFTRRFPAQVWRLRHGVGLAIVLMTLGALCGYALTARDSDLFFSLVSDDMAQGRSPLSSREELLEVLESGGDGSGGLSLFASFLFSHNARIGMLCFALGFAAGVPVALLLFTNGLILGAFAAIHHQHDLGLEFWAWILPHGVTELLAVCVCGGAGFVLGQAVVFPGRFSRLTNLARHGREAAGLVLGAVAMFFVAALLEGYFRQLVVHEVPRLSMVFATGAFWWWYFTRLGRRSALPAAAEDSVTLASLREDVSLAPLREDVSLASFREDE